MYLFSKYFYICVYMYVHICVCMCIYVYICVYLNISSLRYQDFDLKKRQARQMGLIAICTMQPIFHKSTPTLWLSPDHPIPCHHPWSFGSLLPEGPLLVLQQLQQFRLLILSCQQLSFSLLELGMSWDTPCWDQRWCKTISMMNVYYKMNNVQCIVSFKWNSEIQSSVI